MTPTEEMTPVDNLERNGVESTRPEGNEFSRSRRERSLRERLNLGRLVQPAMQSKDAALDGAAWEMSTDVLITDARLQELAAQPVEDLFPAMKSAPAVAPWLMVFAFLPLVCGIAVWTLNEQSARWALRALNVAQSISSESASAGAAALESGSLSGAPPLVTWLTAWMMWAFGADSRFGMIGVACLAVAGTVWSAAKLGQRIGSPRVAWLTAVCCAGHPLLLNSTHSCGPEALGVCLMTVSLERFLAHLDGSVGIVSGRLLVAGLAWGGCWLAIGWPALALGAALSIHVLLFSASSEDFTPAGYSAQQNFRRSLAVWWLIGLATGGWWLIVAVRDLGVSASWSWLLDTATNPISPLFPFESRIARWGATVGNTFLLGWIALGVFAMLRNRKIILTDHHDGRAVAVLLWWLVLLLCRLAAVRLGADPTLWDVLQIVPACLTAAFGIELVLQRTAQAEWLLCGILIGLLSLLVHIPRMNSWALNWAAVAGASVCLIPLIRNLMQARSVRWSEEQIRLALQGLILSTWIAHVGWGVLQAFPGSQVEVQLANQLAKVKDATPKPGAIVIVTDAAPSNALEFQLRRRWPAVPVIVGNRWESAVSKSLPVVSNWSEAEFLVVELTRRDSQFRRPGAGWIVTQAGEPRRYHGDKLTLHRVSIQSP